jgi:hypothetical protein
MIKLFRRKQQNAGYGMQSLEAAIHAATNPPCPTFIVKYREAREGGSTELYLHPDFGDNVSLGMEMLRKDPSWLTALHWYWYDTYGEFTNVIRLGSFKGNYPKLAVAAIQALITSHLNELVTLHNNLNIIKASNEAK